MRIVIECDNGYQVEVMVREHIPGTKTCKAASLPAKDAKAITKAIKKAVEDNKPTE